MLIKLFFLNVWFFFSNAREEIAFSLCVCSQVLILRKVAEMQAMLFDSWWPREQVN